MKQLEWVERCQVGADELLDLSGYSCNQPIIEVDLINGKASVQYGPQFTAADLIEPR